MKGKSAHKSVISPIHFPKLLRPKRFIVLCVIWTMFIPFHSHPGPIIVFCMSKNEWNRKTKTLSEKRWWKIASKQLKRLTTGSEFTTRKVNQIYNGPHELKPSIVQEIISKGYFPFEIKEGFTVSPFTPSLFVWEREREKVVRTVFFLDVFVFILCMITSE